MKIKNLFFKTRYSVILLSFLYYYLALLNLLPSLKSLSKANSLPKIEMGSGSESRISCFQCKEPSSSSDQFRNGWRLRNGEFAKLCPRCASIFDAGRFCETFHPQEDGWRDCESCGKLVHCGCIASFSTHMLLDFGGVICINCTRINLIQDEIKDMKFGRLCFQARNQSLPVEIQQALSEKSAIESQYLPHCTPSELQQIPRNSGSVVTPLFEKQLTNSDAEVKLGRLVLPKRCAETYFPDLSDPRGFLMKMYDVEGKVWEFVYRYWINSGSKMYILEGLKEFMIAKKWQAGDIVTFYRVDPAGSFVIGLRKKSPTPQANEASTS